MLTRRTTPGERTDPMSLTDLPPDRRAHPRLLVAGAMERYSLEVVREWCEELLAGRVRADDPGYPRIEWLGGAEDWKAYWARTWGGRGLLHAGPPARPEVVHTALRDEHWRVREMGLKVMRAHLLDDPDGTVPMLLEDQNQRVRAAAARLLRREGAAGA